MLEEGSLAANCKPPTSVARDGKVTKGKSRSRPSASGRRIATRFVGTNLGLNSFPPL